MIGSSEMDCTFCRIVAGREPASIVDGDEHTLAFMDLRQPNPGKVLVIPRRHAATIAEVDDETAAQLGRAVARVARAVMRAFAPPGLAVYQFNGAAAGQDVFHVHVHIVPRHAGDGLQSLYAVMPEPVARPILDAYAARIRATLDIGADDL